MQAGLLTISFSYWIGIASCCSIVSYGDAKGPVFNAIKNKAIQASVDQPMSDVGATGPDDDQAMAASVPDATMKQVTDAITLANCTHNLVLRRFGDTNILPYLHTVLVFMHDLTSLPAAMDLVGSEYPWKLTALMLNTFLDSYTTHSRIESEAFPEPENGYPDKEKGD